MKKIIALILTALCIFCAACDSTPAGTYRKLVSNYNDEDGVICNFVNEVSIVRDEKETSSVYEGVYTINNEDNACSIIGTLSAGTPENGQITTGIETYYVDGKLYSDIAGNKIYKEMSYSDVLKQIGLCGLATGLSEEDFQGIVLSKTENGDELTFIVPQNSFDKFNGVSSFLSRIAVDGDEKGSLTIEAVKGSIIIGSGNRPASQTIAISAIIKFEDKTVTVNDEIKTTFEYGDATEIIVPDSQNFREIQ